MSYNGSGTFNVNTAGQPVVTGTVISSTAFNALTADLATGLSTAITKDGQTTTTARITFAQGISSTLVTDATSSTTGSIITAGGMSCQKALNVGTTTTLGGALTYGGVTLNNAVTGTGNMVLSASPTLTGTLAAAAATFSGDVTASTATASAYQIIQNNNAVFMGRNAAGECYLMSNASKAGNYLISGAASQHWQNAGVHYFDTAPSGTAGNPITFTTRATINSSGLGIGMTPSNILDITQNQNAGSFVNILNNNASGGAYAAFQAGNGTKTVNFGMTGTGYTTSGILTPNIGYIYCSPGLSIGSGDVIKFSTAGLTEVARFDASGLFQLGTTGGIGALNVTAPASTRYAVFNAPTSGYAGMDLQSAGTRYATIGQASMRVTGGSDTDLALSAVNNLIFAHSSTEVARFDTSGNLLVGCTAQPSGSVKGSELGSNANKGYLFLATNTTASDTIAYFYNPNGLVGSITTSASATAYNTSSDARLKNNITDAGDAGAIIDALKVRQWDWKVDGLHQDFGFVAQEEAQVYAPAVTVGDDGEEIERQWQRDDSKLVPLLVKEIQSLRQRLAAAGIA